MRSLIQTFCIATLMLTGFAAQAGIASEPDDNVTDNLAVPEAGKLEVADVAAMLEANETVFVFDANGRESYLKGHIPGAQWIQYDAVTAADLPESKDAKLVFYCYNPMCGASPLAAKKAVSLGYRNVWLLPEGITGWRKASMAVVTGEAAR
jgi:rhodanese-related sulfurtransferase